MARTRTLVTFADRLVLYMLLGAGLVLMLTGAGRAPGASVRVEGPGSFERVVPLGERDTLSVSGPLGTTVVEVDGGAARILESPCPHGLCMRMGSARAPGQTLVCVPNRVVVTVAGGGPAPVDAVTR
jgi:hypothetical protein